MKDFKKL